MTTPEQMRAAGTVRFAPGCDMVSAALTGLRESFEAAARSDGDVILDLASVGKMDGSGIGAIAHLERSLGRAGFRVLIENAQGQPLGLLCELGLKRLLRSPAA
jgi:anti-anti-sigma regulatory factor